MTVRTLPLLLLGAVALAACTQGAQAPQPVGVAASAAPIDRLVAAIEAEGCVFNTANSGAVQLRAGVTRDELLALNEELARQGRLESIGTPEALEVRLLSDNCI
jgi:hypothetical protein